MEIFSRSHEARHANIFKVPRGKTSKYFQGLMRQDKYFQGLMRQDMQIFSRSHEARHVNIFKVSRGKTCKYFQGLTSNEETIPYCKSAKGDIKQC